MPKKKTDYEKAFKVGIPLKKPYPDDPHIHHNMALTSPHPTKERPILLLVAGFLAYADTFEQEHGTKLMASKAANPWAALGFKIMALAKMGSGRLLYSAIEKAISDAMDKEGVIP